MRITTMGEFERDSHNLTDLGYKVSRMMRWWAVVTPAFVSGYRYALFCQQPLVCRSGEKVHWGLDWFDETSLFDYRTAVDVARKLLYENSSGLGSLGGELRVAVVNMADAMRDPWTTRPIRPGSVEALSWPIEP